MKKYILLLVSFVLAGTLMARQLTPDEALALALGKMNVAQPERTRAFSADANAVRASLTYTKMNAQEAPLYYVYDCAEGGFIIASADDRTSVLLGYTDSGDFAGAQQNQSFMVWLNDCSKALTHIGSMPEMTRSASAGTRALTTPMSPLLGETQWDQKAPYNLLTPLRVGYPNGEAEPDTVHAPTGCGATALAQVMMYYQWPTSGSGNHTNEKDSLQTVDFSQSTYQWSKMLPTYKGGESEESQLAVAQLMYGLGCALNMNYSYSSSGSIIPDLLKALTTYFGYDKSIRFVYRTTCSTEEWNNLLMTELNEKRPVVFRADDLATIVGHYFVIDGYDINGLYHVNWGWGGLYNGYFDMNLMDPVYQGFGGYNGGYALGQGMILGLKPDMGGTGITKPELMVEKHFMFDEQTQQWTYSVNSYGFVDFTGEVGIAIESPTGEVAKLKTDKYDAQPFQYVQEIEYSFEAPAPPGPGYKLYPYYCYEVDGEMKRIPAAYMNSYITLYSVEKDGVYVWKTDEKEVADCKIDHVEIQHNYVGFDLQFIITFSNAATSPKEYVDDVYVEVSKMVDGEKKLVCYGYAFPFIMPGETKELVVRCNHVEEEFEGKIDEGEYIYTISFWAGCNYYPMDSASFEMVNVPPSDITYTDFAINKTEFLPGEELTASMTVVNAGGYDEKTLSFVIFRESDLSTIDYKELHYAAIEADSSEAFTFNLTLPSGPDNYVGAFYADNEQLDGAPTFRFSVVDPTAIDNITSTSDSGAKSTIYDLFGNRLKQIPARGFYIDNGGKQIKLQ